MKVSALKRDIDVLITHIQMTFEEMLYQQKEFVIFNSYFFDKRKFCSKKCAAKSQSTPSEITRRKIRRGNYHTDTT
jgi:hypothetical protein